ncbi:MAG: hypothetical protein OEN20_02720, partial [Gammaproteobacteria bacterium]|nr:hypothetical protein [Gammaproteobacteria bacterium]
MTKRSHARSSSAGQVAGGIVANQQRLAADSAGPWTDAVGNLAGVRQFACNSLIPNIKLHVYPAPQWARGLRIFADLVRQLFDHAAAAVTEIL